MDFQRFSEMTSPEINLNKKILKMSDIELTNSASSELSAGFSTPPSSSLDTCDSGFNDLYSNSFTLISSASSKSSCTTPAQIDNSDSSPESAQLMFDDNSATEIQNTTTQNVTDDGPTLYSGEADGNPYNEAQLDLNISDLTSYDHTNNACVTTSTSTTAVVEVASTTTEASTANKNRYGENDADDYNDDSNMSDISDLSDVFKLNSDIMPDMQRSIDWVHMQIASGVNPRECLSRIFVNSPKQTIPENITDNDLWRVIAAILSDPPRRQRLQHIQTIEAVCETIKKSKNIIVLTGAGVSVSCGIPDFRSRDGIYERLRVEYPDMKDPQSMFDISYFARDPRPFYQFAKEIYPGQFKPSLSHRFIKLLERKGKLLRNYTQNIDTLERVAGIENVIECHGSFATASCTRCKYTVEAEVIQDDIFHQRIPMCKICDTPKDGDNDDNDALLNPRPEQPFNYNQLVTAGVMKPDIVFFGESLPDKFHSTIELDKSNCDLLIVIGSSLKVRPVALIPSSINQSIPQILINREQLDHFVFDVELLGDSDVIINHMLHTLGEDWNDICPQPALKQTNELIISPMNVHNIPLLLSNAVIKKPQEPAPVAATSASTADAASVNSTVPTASASNDDGPQLSDESCIEKSNWKQSQSSQDSGENERATESYLSMANFLPDNSFFYNEKNCYIFPGAEIWWNKDSDLESTSSDSSINDDDDDDDIEDMELSTIERNEMIGNVESTIAVENLLENTNEHEFNKYLLKRSANTSLEHIQIDDSEIDEMNCSKRLKFTEQSTETTGSSIDHQPHHHHHHHHHNHQNHQHHVEHTSTMCDTTLDNSCSSSNTSDPSLPPQNEVFSPKL